MICLRSGLPAAVAKILLTCSSQSAPASQLMFLTMMGSLICRPRVDYEMTKKNSYEEVRCWLLDCYYQYCRGKLIGEKQWAPDEFEFGYAYDQIYDADAPVLERLMVEVLVIVLAAGRAPAAEEYHRQKIANLLAESDLKVIFYDANEDEIEGLLQDMKILRLV